MTQSVSNRIARSMASVAAGALLFATVQTHAQEYSDAYSVVRGGQLYDKWFTVAKHATKPEGPNPAYPKDGNYLGKKGADWRCKECHGWDYAGAAGAYNEANKHFTGIKGIQGMQGADVAAVVAVLKDETHGFGDVGLNQRDLLDLANFVSAGQIDVGRLIDLKSKKARGDELRGQAYYEVMCSTCHGLDGRYDDNMKPVGFFATDNPWETLHKIRFGHPGTEMTPMNLLGVDIYGDILTYAQTLPTAMDNAK
jgi:cytochrome c5